ncbi:MAG: nucleotide sugar dehydrogenase [Arsenophonus sp.]|nr:MAG: nucleotide sugar dehydrogenase [Arsenophonus sp.]
MKIAIVGIGYVGLSNAMLLAQHNEVVALDIISEKVNMLNKKQSPIIDKEIQKFLKEKKLNFIATTEKKRAYKNADFVVISIPTNYDNKINSFNTASIESIIDDIYNFNTNATIIIKSTIPIGFTARIKKEKKQKNIIFSPEFSREGKALYDNLYPSRIVIGEYSEKAKIFTKLLLQGAYKKDITVLFTNSNEAEAIKLFSNAYLAMRIAYFNELDTYSYIHKLNTRKIIEGVAHDPRIGMYYNNPSFGFGGYCLPKDTKQLVASYNNIPNNLIKAIVKSNYTRKNFIAKIIINKNPKTVGIYRLIMKSGSDNFRTSSIKNIMNKLRNNGIKIIIYEPFIKKNFFLQYKVINDLKYFKKKCDIILANRIVAELKNIKEKIYTRDLFGNN